VHVPLADLGAQYRALRSEIDGAVARVLESGRYVLGEEVEALERTLAAETGRAHGVGVSSGSDALLLALWALGVGPGDEVITTTYTFFATVGAIVRRAAHPIFVDVDPQTLQLDLEAVRRAVTPRTRAIVGVPLFGRPLSLQPLADLTVPLVLDGAQAVGCPHLGAPAAATTLSFFPTKNLGAVGDGGMILVDDAGLADQLRTMRQHGSRPKYVHHQMGGNFRLDALQAAILRAKHPMLSRWNAQRRDHAAFYRAELGDLGELMLPPDEPGHVYHHFVLRSPRRDALRTHLRERDIESEVYYPVPLHRQPCFQYLGYPEGSLPAAEQAAREVLALPVHPQLDDAQRAHVVAAVRSFHGR
jgi:dTDP-4-amino-4,6-dideoxygalactose transaminase